MVEGISEQSGKPSPWYKTSCMFTSCLLIALGVTVLLGWYLNIPFLVQVFPSFAPMQANTALGFLLTGGGLFAMSREWLKGSIISGILLIVLGTLTLSQYLFNINLGIDEILVEQYSIMQNVSHAGRMAPNSALAFILTGASLLTLSIGSLCGRGMLGYWFLSGSVLIIGTVSVAGYLSGAETAYGWAGYTEMAIHTALGFVVAGVGLLLQIWTMHVAGKGGVSENIGNDTLLQETSARPFSMRRNIGFSVILVMMLALSIVGSIGVREIYIMELEQERENLAALVQVWGGIVESQVDPGQKDNSNYLALARARAVNQVMKANLKLSEIGKSGELLLATKNGDNIEFIRSLRGGHVMGIPLGGQPAEYVKQVLLGQTGAMIGEDYRGVEVIAAYRPLPKLGMGLVAKVDLSEISRPYIRAVFLAISVGIVVILLCAIALVMKLDPVFKRLERNREQQSILNRMMRIGMEDISLKDKIDRCLEDILSVSWIDLKHEGIIFLANEKNRELYMVAHRNIAPELLQTCARMPYGKCLCGRSAQSCKLLFSSNSRTDERHETCASKCELPHAHYVVPIQAGKKLLGVLTVYLEEGHREMEAEKTFLSSLASALGGIIERAQAEEALRLSEERYALAALGSNDGLWDWNLKNDEIYFSSRGMAMLGYGVNEVTSTFKECELRVHKDDRDSITNAIKQYLASSGGYFKQEYRILHKDGSYRWILMRGVSIWDESGKPHRFAGSFTDITRRKKEGLEMRKLSSALHQTADTVVITDTDGLIEYVNPAFERITGYRPDEAIGHTPGSLIKSGNQPPEFYKGLWDVLKRGETFQGTFINRCKDGRLFYEQKTITPIKNNRGQVTCYLSTGKDVTELRRTEDILERFGRILDSTTHEIYLFDASDLHFVQVNKGALDNTGYSKDELMKMTPLDLKPEFSTEQFDKVVKPLRQHNDVKQVFFETIHQRKDGSTYPVEVRIQLSYAETPALFVAIIQDITERKQTEKELRDLLKENRHLGQRMITIQEDERRHLAHELHDELGQAMSALKIDAGFIRESTLADNPAVAAAAIDIEQAVEETVGKIRKLTHELRPATLDHLGLVDALREKVDEWCTAYENMKCFFSSDGELAGLPEVINITLYRTLQESLTNISRHAGASMVDIHLERLGNKVNFLITDNGKGMDLSEKSEGIGLLGIRERVSALGGELEVNSKPDGGVAISVSLPFSEDYGESES